jgi:hypothetical protein
MNDDIKPSGENKKTQSKNQGDFLNDSNQEPIVPLSDQIEDKSVKPKQKDVDIEIDEAEEEASDIKSVASDKDQGKFRFLAKFKLKRPTSKKELMVLAVILIVVLAAVYLAFFHSSKAKVITRSEPNIPVKTVPTTSDLVPSTLSGLNVAPAANKTPVTGVMIENSEQARPQSGLSQASVVFEALAEGGITRFLALYQDQAPGNVGPIRSVRPYYLQWALGFDASVAHVGGSPDALSDVTSWNVKDLNQFYNGSAYHRISTRQAPHNVYTSIANLNQLESSKGYTSTNFTGFPRKAAQPSTDPTATSISLALSSSDYNVSYSYNKTTNSYDRSEGGSPMIDANTNKQISPNVVVAIVVPLSRGSLDSSGAYYSVYQTIGSGQAYVFEDGNVVSGKWTKSSNSTQIQFTSDTGQIIALNPGQTWITAVSSAGQVSYTP